MARLSYRVAMRLKCLSLLKKRSMRLRSLYATASCGIRTFRVRLEGMTASAPASAINVRK